MRARRREIRKKGFILSFGDIILPFVGIMAIGLLVVAGKLFFMNGLRPSVSVVPDVASEDPIPQIPSVYVPTAEVGTEKTQTPTLSQSEQTGGIQAERPRTVSSEQGRESVPLEITATPVAETPKEEQPADMESRANAKPASTASKSQGPAWRVQVGAYGSKAGANEIIAKLTKAGYKATVYSGTKYHKVWVQAGNTKQSAEAVASRLKKAGFPGSYVVPPPPSR